MSTQESRAAVVLCAGKGTRMKSATPKVIHPLLGRPLCYYPIRRAFDAGVSRIVAVIGWEAVAVESAIRSAFPEETIAFAVQQQPRGTGDAVRSAQAQLAGHRGSVLILYGDVPLLTEQTLASLYSCYAKSSSGLALVTCRPADPSGYGRVVRVDGRVQRIVEHKDASAQELEIGEVNAGVYVASSEFLWSAVGRLEPKNSQGELYLTDLVSMAAQRGEVGVVTADVEETLGVNDRVELAARGATLRRRINAEHMRNGVTMMDPESTWVDEPVEIGPDTTLGPQVSLRGSTKVGEAASLGQGVVVVDSVIGNRTHVKPYSVIEESVVGEACAVGPFSRCRPGTVLDEAVHLGNFVETKKAHLRKGSKASHLAYLGDVDVGRDCNIGAGTITCNYDGVNKHQTILKDGVFIGSDTQLVAPVTVGEGAFVAAGTTVTENVPDGALAMSRAPQNNKLGWVARRQRILAARKTGR